MNKLESQWLGRRMAAIPDAEIFPLLNVGSSTLEFRTRTQPYIDANIFAPLRARGGAVCHMDIKAAPGVDVVGDLLDPAFLERVGQMKFRSVMISNLLEHVTVRQQICEVVMKILQPGGYLFVSGPHRYPFHADPIDTMFRPTVEEMHAHFPGTTLVESAIIDSGNWRHWDAAERGRPLGQAMARLFLPFYRPKKWLELVRQSPYIFKHFKAFAIVLQKPVRVGADYEELHRRDHRAARTTQPIVINTPGDLLDSIGLIVIGRNEGQRLRRCLESARGCWARSVYVDSGSTDGSVALARRMGVEVVELDTTVAFTAARARNAGVERLLRVAPDVKFLQFVDGDCEIDAAWWDTAAARLVERPELAAVCGRRRERFPEASPYNRMCDLEWDTPVGDAAACGGDSLMRRECFEAVGGFDPTLIAGEEPELCLRYRARGWKVERLDAEMTLHDAAMHHASQWWRRETRTGHAYAEAARRFGGTPERFGVVPARRNWFWGLAVPLLTLAPAYWTRGLSLLLLLGYPLLWVKIFLYCRRQRAMTLRDARLYATSCTLAKFPQVTGQVKFVVGRIVGKPSKLIEYKTADVPAPANRDADAHPGAAAIPGGKH